MADPLGPVDRDELVEPYFGDGEVRSGRRRLLPTVLAAAVMAIFAGGLWLAYFADGRQSGGSSPVPLIRAAPGPFKHKPAEPGGMQIPGRHMLIFGERHPKVEHLLPPPEAPLPPPSSTPVQAPAPSPVAEGTSAAPAVNPATAPLRPRPKEVAAPAPTKAPNRASVTRSPPKEAVGRGAGEATHRRARLQLGAVRTPEAARREWDRLKRDNPKLLGRLLAYAVRVDLGAKGIFYRIETEPFANAAAAERLCVALKRRHVGCFLAH